MGTIPDKYPIRKYLLRIGKGLIEDWKWARDTVMIPLAILIGSSLYYIWKYGSGARFDWRPIKSTVIMSVLTLIVYAFLKSVIIAWEIDNERLEELETAKKKIEELTKRPNLQSDAIDLSTMILDFFFERANAAPPPPINRTMFVGVDFAQQMREHDEWFAQQAACTDYDTKTLQIYSYRFSRNVKKIIDSLRRVGLEDSAMERVWETPGIVPNIRIVGERLASLAERIRENRDTT